jgi:hypothetical protein
LNADQSFWLILSAEERGCPDRSGDRSAQS